ncbi:MAG: hypothetical protein E7458_09260 [Ruminococcaceae bacterium]|nr:hypothetical protein [Oscillospiraceae bacterium]
MESIHDYRIRIVTGQYQTAPSEQKAMIRELLGEDPEQKFELYFHWYNLIHELGHAIMMFHSDVRPHPAEEELLVNQLAVAYWTHYGESKRLSQLRTLIHDVLNRFPAYLMEQSDYLCYAKSHWEEETFFTFLQYGWFQFNCVKAALSSELTLQQALEQMEIVGVVPQAAEPEPSELEERSPAQIIEEAVSRFPSWGILLPDQIEVVLCNDANCHMCEAVPLHKM